MPLLYIILIAVIFVIIRRQILHFIAIVTTHIEHLHKFSVKYWTQIQPLHTNSTALDEFNSTQIQPLYTNSITQNELYTIDFPDWLLSPENF